MVWNEPGGGRGKDPWEGRGGGEPPDLDEVARKMKERFRGLFGGGQGNGGRFGLGILIALILLALLIWEITYIIQPPERGVVLRFGAHVATLEPGLNFRLPRPIESVEVINVDQIRSFEHRGTMLTQDENIVDVELAVQYRIKDAQDYTFNVFRPDAALAQTHESATRTIIGKSKLDFVLTEGRAQISSEVKELTQQILDLYSAGVLITSVNMQPAKPPDEVKGAFDDAIKAREDEQRLINEAEAYQNEVTPRARGAAARITEDSHAYRSRVIVQAQGEANRFQQLLVEYEKAPEVMRRRLYLETMEAVLSSTPKVLVDAKGGNNLLYLPIDKLIERKEKEVEVPLTTTLPSPPEAAPETASSSEREVRDRTRTRIRGTR
ncbi:MAG TPA: FtsH protease activity modulator HflK [Gammaproteobacteria bacterium]|jgi:membrane protease subunit HflK|nr:FtsH protease activity modulator HflK [Gammaproteobacteria bacterium]